MVDYHTEFVDALNSILPTHYELILTSGLQVPCISYMEVNNYETNKGDTLGYSRVSFQVKVWGYDLEIIQGYAKQIDEALNAIGWYRTSTGTLGSPDSTMIQKIMTYEALFLEEY